MTRINMIVTETMKNQLYDIAQSKQMNCSELIRFILELMLYRIRGTKTKKNRRAKKYRRIDNGADKRVRFSFYAAEYMFSLISNIESETDCWSKSAFIRKIFDIYLHYVSQNAEVLFIKLAKQAETDYQYKLHILKQHSEKIIVTAQTSPTDAVLLVEYGQNLEPLSVLVT